MQTFSARVVRTTDLTHDVREIELRLVEPATIAFLPGQFVSFRVERPDLRHPITRAYSIASSPDRAGAIDLVFNRVPGGPGSEYLFSLREGDDTGFRGPVGSFTLRPGTRDLLFVATGTGIAPFRSMLHWLAEHEPTRRVTLFWGVRSERDVYYQEELAALAARLRNFSFVTTLSQPEGRWTGVVGRVLPLVERVESVSNLEVFACGNSAMIADVTGIIRAKGICPIHREQYYADSYGTPS
jgi:CDP-4-dehydro-6-deoxyglucose reductase, E3